MEPKTNKPAASFQSTLVLLLDEVQSVTDNPDAANYISTGLVGLDKILGGLRPGDLVAITSRPGHGRSTLAQNVAEHAFIKEGLPLAYFSMELSAMTLSARIVASTGEISASRIETGRLFDEEWIGLSKAIDLLAPLRLSIDDRRNLALADLVAAAIAAKDVYGALGLVVVDGLQMMDGDAAANLRGLKALASEIGCPVIFTAPVGASAEARANMRPRLFDLSAIPGLDSIPDTILAIYRDELYSGDFCKEPGIAEVAVIKQRAGPLGCIKLAFVPARSRFEEIRLSPEEF